MSIGITNTGESDLSRIRLRCLLRLCRLPLRGLALSLLAIKITPFFFASDFSFFFCFFLCFCCLRSFSFSFLLSRSFTMASSFKRSLSDIHSFSLWFLMSKSFLRQSSNSSSHCLSCSRSRSNSNSLSSWRCLFSRRLRRRTELDELDPRFRLRLRGSEEAATSLTDPSVARCLRSHCFRRPQETLLSLRSMAAPSRQSRDGSKTRDQGAHSRTPPCIQEVTGISKGPQPRPKMA
mmetsp:Transcript_29946/g.79829  ORF Transcript_29946/g.79829 Transcript_29946/m.79829 type:complete len:235 (-) Transcript_29946:3-707(-)